MVYNVSPNSANSSSTPLLGAAVFTGSADDVATYATVSVIVDTDVDGTLAMQWSTDKVNWDRQKVVPVDQTIGSGSVHTLEVIAQYFRVVYTNGASAQSHFRLQTLYGVYRSGFLTTSPDEVISRINDTQLMRVANDVEWDLARGLFADKFSVHKFGDNPSTPAGERDIWVYGSNASGNIDYPWPTAAEAVRVQAGGNAADTAAGAGAQEVTIVGLDENWNEQTESVATAGASASASTTTTFVRINRAYVSKVGTYGAANTGSILIENVTTNAVLAALQAGAGQTQLSMYTVPAGYTAFMRHAHGDVNSGANKELTLRMYQRQDADNTAANMRSKRLVHKWESLSGAVELEFHSFRPFPEKTDLWWTSEGNAGSGAAVAYDLHLVKNNAGTVPQ